MRDRHNLDDVRTGPVIDDKIRKSPQQITASAVQIGSATFRIVLNVLHGRVQLLPKSGGCDWTSFGIPVVGCFSFVARGRMEVDHHGS